MRDTNVVERALFILHEDIFFHPSNVTTGTWSFDIFIPEDDYPATNEIWFIFADSEDFQNVGFPITIEHQPSTVLEFKNMDGNVESVMDTVAIGKGERLTGWHHFDITRDDNGDVKVYFNREFIYEINEDFPNVTGVFGFWVCCEGPVLDNVVVRNQVIDIQPGE